MQFDFEPNENHSSSGWFDAYVTKLAMLEYLRDADFIPTPTVYRLYGAEYGIPGLSHGNDEQVMIIGEKKKAAVERYMRKKFMTQLEAIAASVVSLRNLPKHVVDSVNTIVTEYNHRGVKDDMSKHIKPLLMILRSADHLRSDHKDDDTAYSVNETTFTEFKEFLHVMFNKAESSYAKVNRNSSDIANSVIDVVELAVRLADHGRYCRRGFGSHEEFFPIEKFQKQAKWAIDRNIGEYTPYGNISIAEAMCIDIRKSYLLIRSNENNDRRNKGVNLLVAKKLFSKRV